MKKGLLFTVLLGIIFLCIGCSFEFGNGTENEVIESSSENNFVINDKSTIEEDFILFNLEMKKGNEDLALSDLVVMFPADDDCYVYFCMPDDSENYVYRVNSITINEKEYVLGLLQVDGCYQKYKLSGFEEIKNDSYEYEITEVDFYNEKSENDIQTYNMSQTVTIMLDDEKFLFDQEYKYSITLDGQCFESIYQFNKDNNELVDLWSKVIGNVDALDTDKRSFFYFAFKCYDVERDIHFIPEDILQLDVEFDRLTYEYQGNDKNDAENIVPVEKTVHETIKPDTQKIVAADEKRSNKRLYIYDTINKLSEADLSQNIDSSNAAVLTQAAKQYDWAVQFGAKEGYAYKNIEAGILFNHKYDINYTKVKNFNAIHIIYRYDGKKVSTGTNSLIKAGSSLINEDNRQATGKEIDKYTIESIRQNKNLSPIEKMFKIMNFFIEKILQAVKNRIEPIMPFILIILLGIVAFKLRKSKPFRRIRKYIKQKLKDTIDD